MLIVEGPDGSGKTTLIQGLQERYGFEVAPRVVSKDAEALVDLKDWVEANLAEGFQDLIFDRHRLISEPIYGALLRPQAESGFDDFIWLSRQFNRLRRNRPVIIYCMPPKQVVIDNIMADPENDVVKPVADKLYNMYAQHIGLVWGAGHPDIHPIIWDYTRDGQEEDPLAPFDYVIHRRFRRTKKEN